MVRPALALPVFVVALAASTTLSCQKHEATEVPTMVPTASAPGTAAGGVLGGSCARLAMCCRAIASSGSASSGSAQGACGAVASVATGGAESEAGCATALTQVVALASIGGVVPTECRGPEASVMGSLGALPSQRTSNPFRGRPLSAPSVVNGSLATGDSVDTDGALYDEYRVFVSAGTSMTFVARGGASRTTTGATLDMYLVLLQNGVELQHDDDSAGSLNSRIVFTSSTSGWYQVRVRTFGSGVKEGDYVLQTFTGAVPSAT